MIKRPTVLILGAGASVPYGYPTGQGLLRDICHDLTPFGKQTDIWMDLNSLGMSDSLIEAFGGELAGSEVLSVDEFLGSRSEEYLAIGKLAMAWRLVRCEDPRKLVSVYRSPVDDIGWYQYLFKNMVETKLEDFGNNDLSVITFNYDRSLEFYWYGALRNRFGKKNDAKIIEMLKQMRIVHVYGRLGEVPWGKGPCREYYRPKDLTEIKALSDQIIVMPEGEKTSEAFEKARHYLRVGTYVYCLGSGYHAMNLERLGIRELRDKHLHGSSVGLEQGEVNQIRGRWGILFPEPGLSILDLIRKYYPLE